MKKKNYSGRKIIAISIIFVFVLGLAYFRQTFFVRKGIVAGEENQNSGANLEGLKNKIGPDVEYSVDRNTGRLTFIVAKKEEIPLPFKKLFSLKPEMAARYFMQEYGKYFGLENPSRELIYAGKKSDEKMMSHVAFSQKYGGVPIFGAQAIVHLGEDNSVKSANAKFVPNVFSETQPKISAKRAVKEAGKYWGDLENKGDKGSLESSKPQLYIFNKGLLENKKSDINYLVWMVKICGKERGGCEYFFINARDGSFVYHLSGRRAISRNVYDGNSGSYVLARSEGQGATGITDADNIYDILDSVHNYFNTKFGRNGANKLGGLGDGLSSPYADTDAYVRIDNSEAGCPQAFFDGYSVKFCSGEAVTDIAGHEYQHGVSYHSVLDAYGQPWGLDYAGESGATEEAYASIFGETFEQFRKGSVDWQLGEDSNVPGYESVSFSFSNPQSIDIGYGPYPAKTSDLGFYCGADDYGGVHQNSSVLAHAAYLAAVGGDYNGRSIGSAGIDIIEQVYYRAMNYYFTMSTDFEAAYNSLNTACNDLYGEGSFYCVEIKESLQAVELDQLTRCEGRSQEEEQAQITADVISIPYSVKKNARRRINFSMASFEINKKKWVTVRIGGRKVKVTRVKSPGGTTIVAVNLKYRKWARGNYGVAVSYKRKIGKSWQKGTVSEDNVLSII